MKICFLLIALVLVCAAEAQTVSGLEKICLQYTGFDRNSNGIIEIENLNLLEFKPTASRVISKGLVLVLAESRLLPGENLTSRLEVNELRQALGTWTQDLQHEGWDVAVVTTQVYGGPLHQDGETLLALREFLRGVKSWRNDLAGVVIVGNLPEAMLVRRYNWRQRAPQVYKDGTDEREDFGGQEVTRIISRSENVAGRCDITLADLDGNWEDLYHREPEDIEWVSTLYPEIDPAEGVPVESEWFTGGVTAFCETGSDRYEDFVYVNDGKNTFIKHDDGTVEFQALDALQNDECGTIDLARSNPMSVPDILISRINARNIALTPKADVIGKNGEGLLNEQGLPQTVTFESAAQTPRGLDIWEFDEDLEFRLLTEYFNRNHRYRTGEFASDFTPAAATFELDSPMGELRVALPEWQNYDTPGADLQGETASLENVIKWFTRPAIMRFINAHSDPWGSHFAIPKEPDTLDKTVGQPWSWQKINNQLVPTLGQIGKLDFASYRSIWQNGLMPDTASFYLHFGCDITRPGGCLTEPYNSPGYAHWQGAEGLLFYCKGLALVGRSKTFYDFPRDFAKQMGEGKNFGEAWKYYFEIESSAANAEEVGGGIGRKRAYFWNVLGDWTLTLQTGKDG